MENIAYSLTPDIKSNLQKAESLRRQILILPIQPRVEMRLKWDALIRRIFFSLHIDGRALTKTELGNIIGTQDFSKLNREHKRALLLKKAFDFLALEWIASPRVVTSSHIVSLYEIFISGKLIKPENQIKKLLDYLQVNPESPIVQAAIAQIEILRLSPFSEGNDEFSRLLSYLFLYKGGYDCRGFLALEEEWYKELVTFVRVRDQVLHEINVTNWIEYFAKSLVSQLEKAYQMASSEKLGFEMPAYLWDINERQKEILNILGEPASSITNRYVQKIFKISQITASRDLAKLVKLSLIFSKGKGRSVSYTKL